MSQMVSLAEREPFLFLVLWSFLGVCGTVTACYIAYEWRKVRRWTIMQELIGQGLSVEEVERLFHDADPPKTQPATATPFAMGDGSRQGALPPSFSPKLVRTTDRKIAGVCGGLARYLGVDPTIVRVVFAIAAVMTGMFPFVVAYIVMACVIPREGTA